jgi:hypothetical protein
MKTKKILFLVAIISALVVNGGQAQVQNRVAIPDINGYKTLQCDFHIHSVFSDGTVWPTVRVDEVFREGLDAMSLTEHLENRRYVYDTGITHNRSYELALPVSKEKDIILIRGAEITRAMPPGHFNAIFLSDCDALFQQDWRQSFAEAKKQNAFVFWNHPSWDAQQPDTTLWFPEHTEIFNNGWLNGIEVVNGQKFCKESFQWCLDKKLTMIGVSDIHQPIQTDVDFAKGEHRTMTLVFARERTAEAIHEALINRRTAIYFNDLLIGEEQYLRSIFENSIEIKEIKRNENSATISFINHSGLSYQLKKTAHNPEIVYFRDFTIKPHSHHTITVRMPANKSGDVNFEISNLLVKPGKGLDYSYKLP